MMLRDGALTLIMVAAYTRVAACAIGALRSWRSWRSVTSSKFGPVEVLAALETLVLALIAHPAGMHAFGARDSTARALAAVLGAALALGYLWLLVWSVMSWRGVFSGHLIIDGQQLVTAGPYRHVRHPLYTGAFLVWGSIAVGNLSVPVALALVVYVIPTYLAYVRSEELMLSRAFGNEYTLYASKVPRFLPFAHPLRLRALGRTMRPGRTTRRPDG